MPPLNSERWKCQKQRNKRTMHTLCNKMFELFWRNKLVPVMNTTWDDSQQVFRDNNSYSTATQCPVDCCEEDWASRLQQTNTRISAAAINSISVIKFLWNQCSQLLLCCWQWLLPSPISIFPCTQNTFGDNSFAAAGPQVWNNLLSYLGQDHWHHWRG